MLTRRAVLGSVTATLASLALGTRRSPAAQPNEPEPASRPSESQPSAGHTFRRPEQAEIIEGLLRDREQPTLVLPQEPDRPASAPSSAESGLLLEGTILVERPGRLTWRERRPVFTFVAEEAGPALHAMEILPNQLLEAMEGEAHRGTADFVISGRVTRYKGRNYLLLSKVLTRVSHGNVSP